MRQHLVARFVKIITAKSVRPRMCIQNVGVYSSYNGMLLDREVLCMKVKTVLSYKA